MLYAKYPNVREETFDKALKMAEQYDKNMQMVILKSQITKHQMNSKRKERERQNIIGKK